MTNTIDEAIFLISLLELCSFAFSSLLCRLLEADWHVKHEDIASILQSIRDPSTTNCLFLAAEKQFEYLNYDNTYQFARKCIKALSSLDNAEAVEKLRILSNNTNSVIASYAIRELKKKDI